MLEGAGSPCSCRQASFRWSGGNLNSAFTVNLLITTNLYQLFHQGLQ